jgi:hypothetical protein
MLVVSLRMPDVAVIFALVYMLFIHRCTMFLLWCVWMLVAGDEWSALRLGRFTPGERAHGTHWIGGWVGPRPGLDDVEKRKFFTLQGLELRPSVVQPVASHCTD